MIFQSVQVCVCVGMYVCTHCINEVLYYSVVQ